jgi:hypothetical protein
LLFVLPPDSSITEAYFQKNYRRALDLCLAYLDGVQNGSISLDAASVRDREYYDVALRACVHMSEIPTGLSLAERSKNVWKGHPSLAMTSAEIYNRAESPRGKPLSLPSLTDTDRLF